MRAFFRKMTRAQIQAALRRIEKCRRNSFYMEGLMETYLLNAGIISAIHSSVTSRPAPAKRPRDILNMLILMAKSRKEVKAVIQARNLKSIKPWLKDMEVYLRTIRTKKPANTKTLLNNGEKAFHILHIAYSKMLVQRFSAKE